MSAQTLEERLTAVETKLEELQQSKVTNKSASDKSDEDVPWWKRIIGIYANSPEFEGAVKFGREWRESEDPPGNDGGV